MLTKLLREIVRKQDLRPVFNNGKVKALVGYKKPPKEHQFKPGNPGGPGRKKGHKTLAPFFREELFKNDAENAKELARRLVSRAATWSDKAAKIVIDVTAPKR